MAENQHIREAIKAVLAAEAEAKRLVASAKAEAGRIIRESQAEAQTRTRQSTDEVRRDAEAMIEASARNAEREKQERLLQVKTELEAKIRLEDNVVEEVVSAALRNICGIR